VHQAKKVSIDGVKRPRGRPPLPETLKRRMQEEQLSRSAAETVKQPLPVATADKQPSVVRAPVSPVTDPPATELPEQPPQPPVVKKRRNKGPQGMARLLVKRPGSKVSWSGKWPPKCASVTAAEPSQPNHQENASELPKVGKLQGPEQPVEVASDQIVPSLSSPIWQPASKRVLDAVCVTDVTACSGVTITVRESSIIDGFFRPRPE